MGINITQFAPPGTVSKLVWDDDMEPGAGKIFKGDLTGNVTGDVTGDLTGVVRGSLLGYLSRNGVVSASSGTLVVPAGSSVGNTAVTITLNGNGTYCIVGNTQKCFYPNPCYIPVTLSPIDEGWYSSDNNSYAKSYDADGVLIDSIGTESGNLNIYGAAYIILNGGTSTSHEDGHRENRSMSVADAYIDAGTSLILGDDTPPDGPKVSKLVWDADMQAPAGKKFKGALEGNVTGMTTRVWSGAPRATDTILPMPAKSTIQMYQLSPGDTMTGTVRCSINEPSSGGGTRLLFITRDWTNLAIPELGHTPQTFTIPEGTNGIYVLNHNNYAVSIKMGQFIVT